MSDDVGIRVRRARATDHAALARSLGRAAYFAERLRLQAVGHGVLFTAWDQDQPVGDVYLWLDPAEEPEIRERLPSVPLLTHLVVAPGVRGRGVGTKLIDSVERLARAKGYDRIALAVRLDNPRAAALYARLGYQDWGHQLVRCMAKEVRTCGSQVLRPERCRVLVKSLAGRAGRYRTPSVRARAVPSPA
jgi:GNAT superfamily N-acetyltransferase